MKSPIFFEILVAYFLPIAFFVSSVFIRKAARLKGASSSDLVMIGLVFCLGLIINPAIFKLSPNNDGSINPIQITLVIFLCIAIVIFGFLIFLDTQIEPTWLFNKIKEIFSLKPDFDNEAAMVHAKAVINPAPILSFVFLIFGWATAATYSYNLVYYLVNF